MTWVWFAWWLDELAAEMQHLMVYGVFACPIGERCIACAPPVFP